MVHKKCPESYKIVWGSGHFFWTTRYRSLGPLVGRSARRSVYRVEGKGGGAAQEGQGKKMQKREINFQHGGNGKIKETDEKNLDDVMRSF